MLVRVMVAVFAFLIAAPVFAADPQGTWAMRAGDTFIMQFKVERTATGWTGEWQRPARFESDGDDFSNVSGPVVRRIAKSARAVPNGVELTFDDPAPRSFPDVFVIQPRSETVADLTYIAFGDQPATLSRVAPGIAIGPWDKSRTYIRASGWPTNAEMTAIFDADQADRVKGSAVDWKIVEPADRQRRARTQALLDVGALRSGDDYYHAAFIFQHGSEPADYLKAHALAVIAAARGKPSATWIAAATLDRYLQSIGQPQIYGTQFSTKDTKTSQGAFDQTLLSDAIRRASRVPALAAQEAQRLEFEKRAAQKR